MADRDRTPVPGSPAPGGPEGSDVSLLAVLQRLATPPEPPAFAPGALVGRYTILDRLGAGGMGEVYRASDARLGREVAIKVLSPRLREDPEVRSRFQQEALAIGRLSHPNVLAVFDVGDCEGRPYLVSELLQGQTLRARLAGGPRLLPECIDLALQIARGLAAAHARGIVHRDLKPENLFLTEDGRLKILDFGIAKLLDKGEPQNANSLRTETGAILGTVGYMSPEQVRGQHVDHRSDLFSCGTTLHEMLAGKTAFERGTPVETGYAILNEEPPELPAHVPPRLASIVRRCLEKRPEDRFQSADQVAAALADCQDGGPVSRPSLLANWAAGASPTRWSRQSGLRGVRLVAMLLAVGLVAGALGTIYFFAVRKPAPGASAPASIAVLPFVNMSSDKETDYFSDGITEELIDALAKVDGLRVIARTSSFSFKGKSEDLRAVGKLLGAANLLEGSVRKEGNRIRITAQLIAAADGVHLWSRTFDRDLTSVLAVQEEIARTVASRLERKLIAARARAGPKAEVLDQALLGRHFFLQGWPDGFGRSVAAYEKAVALDPGHAPAWAGLALARHRFANDYGTLPEVEAVRQKAFEAADRAVALDPELAQAFASRGYMRLSFLDWTGSESDLRRALLLEPGNADVQSSFAALHASLGHLSEAIRLQRKAAELDPLNAVTWGALARLLASDGKLEAARVAATRGAEIAPGSEGPVFELGIVELLEKRPAQALALLPKVTEKDVFAPVLAAMALHDLGRQREAEEALLHVERNSSHVASYCIAWVHAWWGDKDAAFSSLERSRKQHEHGIHLLKWDPLLRGLRGDPRYAALLAKLKLPLD